MRQLDPQASPDLDLVQPNTAPYHSQQSAQFWYLLATSANGSYRLSFLLYWQLLSSLKPTSYWIWFAWLNEAGTLGRELPAGHKPPGPNILVESTFPFYQFDPARAGLEWRAPSQQIDIDQIINSQEKLQQDRHDYW